MALLTANRPAELQPRYFFSGSKDDFGVRCSGRILNKLSSLNLRSKLIIDQDTAESYCIYPHIHTYSNALLKVRQGDTLGAV